MPCRDLFSFFLWWKMSAKYAYFCNHSPSSKHSAKCGTLFSWNCNSAFSSNTLLRTLSLLSHYISICNRRLMSSLSRVSVFEHSWVNWPCLIQLTIFLRWSRTFFHFVSKGFWKQHFSVKKAMCCDIRVFFSYKTDKISCGANDYWSSTINRCQHTSSKTDFLLPDRNTKY